MDVCLMGDALVLDGLTTPQCLAVISRRLDMVLAFELQLLAAGLANNGVGRVSIESRLADRRANFEEWRAGQLDQLQAWLLRCDGRLH
jgi:hypothetical protein